MRARQVKKLWRLNDRPQEYGRHRASGSKAGRRGRRAFLRHNVALRDHSSLSVERKLEILERFLNKLEEKAKKT